ncbi:MAG: hypothetical protein KAI24_22515 [Planctomycetes bacterium]|nr:hypothetical protein [Planctomycetota bacterium]
MNTTPSLVLTALLAAALPAQEPEPVAAAPAANGSWTEGFGRAPTYRSALAQALEDAVAKANGVAIARSPSIRSRIAVVAEHRDGEQEGFFDGSSENEREWVQHQIRGFVPRYEVQQKQKADDRMWEVTVRAKVAGVDQLGSQLVIELVDNDLRSWQLERYEEGGPGRAFDRRQGRFQGPKIGEYLRRSGAVEISGSGRGVNVRSGAERAQREKAGHQLVASHRVVVDWQPLVVQSTVEKPNKARPTKGPRPEYMSGGAVEVSLRIEDLVRDVVMLEETFAVPADNPGAWSADRLDAFVTNLVDKAKAEVAKKIFFTLRPPVVLRKWAGDGGAWFVEARISRRVAAGFGKFSVGTDGTLADPDWQELATATLVGGSASSCTFRLEGVTDASRIVVDVSEVRPVH